MDREQRKAEAIAALERVPTVTPTPAATPTPTPTPIPTVTPTPVLERAYVFNPEDYLGTWRSENGRVKIKIKKLSQKSITFTYSQTNKKKTATCKAKVKKSVAGNATRFSFTDSLGNVAKGYLTFDNGRLYVNKMCIRDSGLGDKAADAVVDAAKQGKFLSKDDFRDRTKVSKTVIDLMDDLKLFGDIPQSNQMSLFDFTG